MAHIIDLIRKEDPEKISVSFEYFPPRGDTDQLVNVVVPECVKHEPVFLDVTWGAGGSTSEKTFSVCRAIAEKNPSIPVNMHLTCTNMPQGLLFEALDNAKKLGICNILALRGDAPAGKEFTAAEDGFSSALDLIRYISEKYPNDFCISCAGYPEGHPSKLADDGSISEEDYTAEIAYLKQKVDAGASLIITQLFFDESIFIRFVKKCREMNITVPIVPGFLPFGNYAGFNRMVQLCKTHLPESMKARVEQLKDDEKAFAAYGVERVAEMITAIHNAGIGVHHYHFYTINSASQSVEVMKRLNIAK